MLINAFEYFWKTQLCTMNLYGWCLLLSGSMSDSSVTIHSVLPAPYRELILLHADTGDTDWTETAQENIDCRKQLQWLY